MSCSPHTFPNQQSASCRRYLDWPRLLFHPSPPKRQLELPRQESPWQPRRRVTASRSGAEECTFVDKSRDRQSFYAVILRQYHLWGAILACLSPLVALEDRRPGDVGSSIRESFIDSLDHDQKGVNRRMGRGDNTTVRSKKSRLLPSTPVNSYRNLVPCDSGRITRYLRKSNGEIARLYGGPYRWAVQVVRAGLRFHSFWDSMSQGCWDT